MKNRLGILLLAVSCLVVTASVPTNSIAQGSYSGWEKDSPYNKLYNYKERDSLKGKLLKFKKLTPLTGMAPATSIILKEGDEKITVHLCPWDYASPKETGLRKGVKTKIKGVWAVIDGKDVFMAAKAKQGDNFEFKVRLTKDGTPFWTMSAEEIASENQ
ncbi:MAG: hypothetical protein ACI8PB_000461 [Desulforhopalus sp.]|jgi:hypothetical protein